MKCLRSILSLTKRMKHISILLGGCIIVTIFSYSNGTPNPYYIEQNNDTIAFLVDKNDSSKIAEIVNWHFSLANDSIYEKIYSHYNLQGYTTFVKSHEYLDLDDLYFHMPISVFPEHKYTRLILDGNKDTLAYIVERNNNEGVIYTPTKYSQADSLYLRKLVSAFQLSNCRIYDTENWEDNELDCYAMFENRRLTIYEKPFKQDTLRLLNYGLDFIRSTYNVAKTIKSSEGILNRAIAIRDLGDFSKACTALLIYKDKAIEVIDSLKYYQPYILRRFRSNYVEVLKEELKDYKLDDITIYDDYEIHPRYELYMSSDYFISEKVCWKIYTARNNRIYLLGIQQVTYNWSINTDYDYVVKVKPKPLSDECIGREVR